MRVGYSFWGFIGPGILDTPDGGRSHRGTLIRGLLDRGHELVLLQPDRDELEAGRPHELASFLSWHDGLPEIDLLWLEWRWTIPGRNTPADRGRPGFTPDLDRQRELIDHYTLGAGTPTLIWDKDLQLDMDDPVARGANVLVAEPALYPRRGAHRLLFPVADAVLDQALAEPSPCFGHGTTDLIYVGNQYDRDDVFDEQFAPAAQQVSNRVLGKWDKRERWPGVNFEGRVEFAEVAHAYRDALVTVLLMPDRYARAGQITQRLFEALLNGCFAALPPGVRGGGVLVRPPLRVAGPSDLVAVIGRLRRAPPDVIESLAMEGLGRLAPLRISTQLEALAVALAPLKVRL
jgi:hypothetical protein